MKVQVSKKHRAVLVASNPVLEGMFPHARRVNGGLLLPHDVTSYAALRRAGYELPNPMMLYYDWCGLTPWLAQRVTASMMSANPRAYVLNEYATGKTRTALWTWDCLNKEGSASKLLVVAPISTLRATWASEVATVMPDRRVQVLGSPRGMSKAQRLKRLAEDADIYVINHDGVGVISKELLARLDIDTLVLDELSKYRNVNQRSRAMKKFVTRFKWVWGMTGSPMPKEPTDVWQQCRIITPGRNDLPEFKRDAEAALMTQISDFVSLPKPGAVERAYSWMQPSARFRLSDVAEVPEMIIQPPTEIELSKRQETAYKWLIKKLSVMIEEHEITAINAGVQFNKLLQVSCGYVYDSNKRVADLQPEARMDTLIEDINACGQKVIVFSGYRHACEAIGAQLKKERIEFATVHGDVRERDRIFHEFQHTARYKVLNAHPECMAHGLNLTAATLIVWYGPVPNLDIYDQANARPHRPGQRHVQVVKRYQSTPVERKVYKMLEARERMQSNMLQLVVEATAAGLK